MIGSMGTAVPPTLLMAISHLHSQPTNLKIKIRLHLEKCISYYSIILKAQDSYKKQYLTGPQKNKPLIDSKKVSRELKTSFRLTRLQPSTQVSPTVS